MAIGAGEIIGSAINAGGQLGSGITDIAVAYSDQKGLKRNRSRMQELEDLEFRNLLGLSEEELNLLNQRSQGAAESAVLMAQQDASRRLANASSGSLAALAERDAALQALGVSQTQQGIAATEADLARRAQQEEEIEARRAYDAQVKANRARAVGNVLTLGSLGASNMTQTALEQGAFDRDPNMAAQEGPSVGAAELAALEEMERLRAQGYDPLGMSRY